MYHYRQSSSRLILTLVICAVLSGILWPSPAGVLIIVPLALFAVIQLIAFFSQDITITSNEVTLKTGVITQKTTEIPLKKINTVAIKRGLLGRMFNYGNIVIFTGNDKSGIKFVGIDKPEAIKRKLKAQ